MRCLIYCFTPYQSGTNQSTAFSAWKGLNEFKKKGERGWGGEGKERQKERKERENMTVNRAHET